ncbi:hypothetical protein T440DRAFT_480810 [Plenodomus tracheiphilus IPT5]|uniref:Uncharacterized protein n=1 Tax=Plenodomus tracheiphilus IPT5 TaxID=1408161 RepID=A0A6A7AZJ6_9PLEO|nr:hypothetical protein T440DRAFT_480810 [Plenodomus tracheiphilus IPT5]
MASNATITTTTTTTATTVTATAHAYGMIELLVRQRISNLQVELAYQPRLGVETLPEAAAAAQAYRDELAYLRETFLPWVRWWVEWELLQEAEFLGPLPGPRNDPRRGPRPARPSSPPLFLRLALLLPRHLLHLHRPQWASWSEDLCPRPRPLPPRRITKKRRKVTRSLWAFGHMYYNFVQYNKKTVSSSVYYAMYDDVFK